MMVGGSESDQGFFCKFSSTTYSVIIFVSTLTLLAITLDHYLFISYPLKYPLMVTWRRTYGVLLCIWVSALLYSPVTVVYTEPTKVRAICFTPYIIYLIGPIGLILYFNYKLFKIARSHVRRIQSSNGTSSTSSCASEMSLSLRIKREIRTVKTFVIVVGVLLFSLFPFTITLLLNSLVGYQLVPLSVMILLGDLAVANSILNPIIYSMRHKEYRNGYRRLATVICSRIK